jgi:hypothetical protein
MIVTTVQVEGASLLCDMEVGGPALFQAILSVAHPGIRAINWINSSRFIWKGVSGDVSVCTS